MNVRVNVVTHGHRPGVLHDLRSMIPQVPLNTLQSSGEIDQQGFCDLLWHWTYNSTQDPSNLRQIILQEPQDAQQQLLLHKP